MTHFSFFVCVSGFFKASYWSENNRADTLIQHYPVCASAIPWSALKIQNILLLIKKLAAKISRLSWSQVLNISGNRKGKKGNIILKNPTHFQTNTIVQPYHKRNKI